MEIQTAAGEVSLSARKARALLAYLALRPGVAVPRETLAGLLWGDRGEEQARASLRQTLSALRKALGKEAANSLIATNESVALVDGGVWVDIKELEQGADASSVDELIATADLYRGGLLEGLTINETGFEHWVSAERERARTLVSRLLTRLVRLLEQENRIEDAITFGAQLLVLDPLQEQIHRTLMRLYMAQGRLDAALSQFEQCRRELADQLDVTPEQATLDLASEVKSRRRQSAEGKDEGDKPARANPSARLAAILSTTAPPLPEKPSIAVLPFTNMSADPEQEYFSDGITEDIITELSRFRSLRVTSVYSSHACKNRALSVVECGSQLGVQYILAGSIRKADEQIRITAQFWETDTRNQLWAERFDCRLEDIFSVQDEMTQKIVSTLVSHVEEAEQHRGLRRSPENLSAYDCWLRGKSLMHMGTEKETLEARELFEKAIDIDPTYAAAHVELSDTYFVEATSTWTASYGLAIEKAYELACKAVDLDPHDSRTHLYLASACFRRTVDFDLAIVQVDEALRLNPNDYYNYCVKGWLSACSGDLEDALVCSNEATSRNPLVADSCIFMIAVAEYLTGNYPEAIIAFSKLRRLKPYMFAWAAAAYAQQNRIKDAKAKLEDFYAALKAYPDAPERSDKQGWLAYWEREFPTQDPAAREHLFEGLRKAGLLI